MPLPQMFLISLAITAVSTILFLAGFGSNVWFSFVTVIKGKALGVTFGLWKFCFRAVDFCDQVQNYLEFAQLFVARFCGSVALIVIIVHLAFLFIFAFKDARKIFITVSYCCLLSAGILNVFGAVAMMSRTGDLPGTAVEVGWGAILTFLAGVMMIVSSLFIVIPVRRGQVEYTTT